MKAYKTNNSRERLNARRINGGAVMRVAGHGYSLHINIRAVQRAAKKALKWTLIIVGTLILFRLGQAAAYAERGYKAYGGEYLILLLPLIWYVFSKTLSEMHDENMKDK